jgi:hypothetical protein
MLSEHGRDQAGGGGGGDGGGDGTERSNVRAVGGADDKSGSRVKPVPAHPPGEGAQDLEGETVRALLPRSAPPSYSALA